MASEADQISLEKLWQEDNPAFCEEQEAKRQKKEEPQAGTPKPTEVSPLLRSSKETMNEQEPASTGAAELSADEQWAPPLAAAHTKEANCQKDVQMPKGAVQLQPGRVTPAEPPPAIVKLRQWKRPRAPLPPGPLPGTTDT